MSLKRSRLTVFQKKHRNVTQNIAISNGNATGKDTACGIQSCSVLRREQPHDCLEPTKTNTRLREDMFGIRNRFLAIHFEQYNEKRASVGLFC